MIRAFVAVDLDPAVVANIGAACGELRSRLTGVRWVAPENYHLTLKFLGSIEDSTVAQIVGVLGRELRLFPHFTISAKGVGVFPGPARPRVLWVGFTGDSLGSLAAKIESALAPLGFMPESRKFSPHLTIGRWRESERAPGGLRRELAMWQAHEFGRSAVTAVNLMQSLLHPHGASYRNLTAVPLA